MPQLPDYRDSQQTCPLGVPIVGFLNPCLQFRTMYNETQKYKFADRQINFYFDNFNSIPTAVVTYAYFVIDDFTYANAILEGRKSQVGSSRWKTKPGIPTFQPGFQRTLILGYWGIWVVVIIGYSQTDMNCFMIGRRLNRLKGIKWLR